jgi:hypothetical protein
MKKLLEEVNIEGLTAECVRKKKDDENSVRPGTEQNYEAEEEWRRN